MCLCLENELRGKKKTKKTHLKYIAVTVNIEGQFLLIFATQVQ